MKKLLLLVIFMTVQFVAMAQNKPLTDVIYLKNGSIIRGVIVEQVPNVSLKMKTADGNIFIFLIPDIEKMTREEEPPKQSYDNNSHTPSGRYRSPGVAWVCSFLVPGLGQLAINNQIRKGVSMLVVSAVGMTVCAVGIASDTEEGYALAGIGALVSTGFWIWSMIDAPIAAGKLNRANMLSWKVGSGVMNIRPNIELDNHIASTRRVGSYGTALGLKLNFKF